MWISLHLCRDSTSFGCKKDGKEMTYPTDQRGDSLKKESILRVNENPHSPHSTHFLKFFIIFLLFSLSSFSLLSEVPELELRQYYQEGTQYVIVVKCVKTGTLEFFYKEQGQSQGAYQGIGTLSAPNFGDLYKIYWNVRDLNDGNYTIMIRSQTTSAILETNVIVNKAHWDISPVQLQYPGWITATYIGDIPGTIDTRPTGGNLIEYSQFILFTRQNGNEFRIEVQIIPDNILEIIYRQLYSNGHKQGTIYYQINDDILEVRVTFPGLVSYSPYSKPQNQTPSPSPNPTPIPTYPPQDSQQLSQILNELNNIKTQNSQISQETAEIKSQLEQKSIEIEDLKNRIGEEETKRKKQESNTLFYILIPAAVMGGIFILMKSKNKENSSTQIVQSEFPHGRPFKPRVDEKRKSIPVEVIDFAQTYNLAPLALFDKVERLQSENPLLSTTAALNRIYAELKEAQRHGET